MRWAVRLVLLQPKSRTISLLFLYKTFRLPESDRRLDVVTVDVSDPDGVEETLRSYFEEIGKGDASALQNTH